MEEAYEVFALRYADRPGRSRCESFLFDDDHAAAHPIDYFLWVIRNEARTLVVDTGFDGAESKRRGRPIFAEPVDCLKDFGIDPASLDTVVITHLHYDHAGSLDRFPNATFHLQSDEMAYATGPCMAHSALNHPFTAEHVCQMVRKVYSGRVVFHDGDAQIAPGIEVAKIGGHTRGLQAVRVKTRLGWLLLASDASHFYENYLGGKIFPIVVESDVMLEGFKRLPTLASAPGLVIPGHDPLVCDFFPRISGSADSAATYRLDVEPQRDLVRLLADYGQV
ncbi:MAG: N-acyl homoserine lactonase family protein [Kiloniellales bacterium]